MCFDVNPLLLCTLIMATVAFFPLPAQFTATTKSTAAAASVKIDQFDEKFKVSQQASAALKARSELEQVSQRVTPSVVSVIMRTFTAICARLVTSRHFLLYIIRCFLRVQSAKMCSRNLPCQSAAAWRPRPASILLKRCSIGCHALQRNHSVLRLLMP